MGLNIGLLIVILLFAVGIGLIVSFLIFLIKMSLAKIKALKQLKENKGVFEFKEDKTEVKKQIPLQSKEKTIDLFRSLVKNKESDLDKFNKANEELNRLKSEYNKGNMSYNDLKKSFEYYQNQDYYKRILNGKKS